MGQEKRKHIRVEHKGSVQFVSENRTFHGSSINISRNGMQVVVNLPQSHESVRSISFELPLSGGRIHVPCRLVRAQREGVAAEQTLGIEFLHEAETQLLLIERFIRDSAPRVAESRQLPRTSCRIANVETDRKGVRVLSVDNLSTDGLLFSFTGGLQPGDSLALILTPSDDPRPLRLRGTVVYVVENAFREAWTAGLRLTDVSDTEEARLRNLILAFSSGSSLRGMYDHLDAATADSGYRITDTARIAALLSGLAARHAFLSILLEDSLTIRECALLELREEGAVLAVQAPDKLPVAQALVGRTAYSGFLWNGSSHYFRTSVAAVVEGRLLLRLPASVFRSDKRSYGRKSLGLGSRVRLAVPQPGATELEVEGTLIDISRRGFLCEVDSSLQPVLRRGNQVRYTVDKSLGLDSHGQIKHVKSVSTPRGPALRIGIEAGIARREIHARRIGAEAWARNRPFLPGAVEPPAHPIESTLVCYRNRDGKELRALLNATSLPARAPVVVIPPSYGKRKESCAPLVATLLANFERLGKPLVTLRYDGINRPGESHNELPNPRRGYEMLSCRISQGLEDLEATLDFVSDNSYFEAEGVVLVTFSMSALDARRYLATRRQRAVRSWISCMGVPCTQTTLRSILGGIDVVSNQRLGIPNGIMGLLGHLVNMDILAQDVLDKRYAFITDARFDMAQIRTPILWITGLHDRWVDPDEVSDLMTVRARGPRQVLEIPCGHNLHSSDDAIQTFKIIARELYQVLHGEGIEPCDPCRPQMLRLLTSERERLQDPAPPSLTEYWRGYLIGNERNQVGYDFYSNLEEFRGFLQEEVDLLELGERETIADLGCGTGLFLEVLLDSLARRPGSRPEYDIHALDLVQEALGRTRPKCERVLRGVSHLHGVGLTYHRANLEPSRLVPVARFLRSQESGYDCLRGKIEGLTSEILDKLLERRYPGLDALVRGAWPTAELLEGVGGVLQDQELTAALELNRAARFLLGRVADTDLRKPGGPDPARALRLSDLAFEVLRFGDSDASQVTAIPEQPFSRIVASLFISYLYNPEYLLEECHRLLEPGGILLVSSMKPDSDISTIFTNYVRTLQSPEAAGASGGGGASGLTGALAMLNEAATLFELEEGGHFRFYTDRELESLLRQADFTNISIHASLGSPPQAWIAVGTKRGRPKRGAGVASIEQQYVSGR